MPYPDPMNRVEFETHAIRVRPEAMTGKAIKNELSNLSVRLGELIDAKHGPLTWRDGLPLIGGAALVCRRFSRARCVAGRYCSLTRQRRAIGARC